MDDASGFTIREDIRVDLLMNDGNAADTLDKLTRFMADEGNIFQQGSGRSCHGVIVRELTPTEIKALKEYGVGKPKVVVPRGLLMPTPLTPAHVQDFAERHFEVVKARKNPKTNMMDTRPADFRLELARRFLDSRLPALRSLRGVAYTPILRPDGAIVAAPGYDADVALWVMADIPRMEVPDNPNRTDAQAAYDTLCELIAEHVFETDYDKVAAIGFLMAPALRPSMKSAPLLVADAPSARTGKDFLLATAALIATGHPPVEFALSDSIDEQHKRIGSALLMGAPFLTLNNINGRLRSTDLTIYLTQGGVVTRAYATTGGATFAPNGNVIAASGNNIILGGDLPERAFISRQDTNMAFPGERRFKTDPHEMVLEDRGKYLSAIFTIARWAISGADYETPNLSGFGGFAEFDRLIRRPLFVLTGLDPVERGKEQLHAERENRWQTGFIDSLADLIGTGSPFRTRDVQDALSRRATMPGETDPLAPLRKSDLAYSLRRAKGTRGTEVRLVAAERPTGGDAVAWYQLEPMPSTAEAEPSALGLRTSEGFSLIRVAKYVDEKMGSTIGKSPPQVLSPKHVHADDGVIL